MATKNILRSHLITSMAAALCVIALGASLFAQSQTEPPAASVPVNDYIVGPQDVLTITSYDQADLSGKFAVEADGTFTYPLIGRFKAGGLTLRATEEALKARLKDEGYFNNPQITVAVEQYRSQKVYVVGEVRSPGTYPITGDMKLVEALARAGSTLPTASGEAVIVHATGGQTPGEPVLPDALEGDNVVRVDLQELQNGVFSNNMALRDGDTIFVPRAESIYVFGQVKNPGAYAMQQRTTTVLQALSLAGGVTDRGSTSRIKIVRIVDGQKKEIRVTLTDVIRAGDTIIVSERFL
jgi:polysaccharide export outer membrane protein